MRDECAKHVPKVNAAIPGIVFEAKDGAGNDVGAVKVTMDGKPLTDRLDGSALAMDPGEHVFAFEGMGAYVERKLVVREGEKARRETIQLGPAPPPTPTMTPTPTPTSPPPSSTGSGQRAVGLILGGVGGVAVGSIFGLSSFSKWSQAKNDCGGGCGPNDPAHGEKSDAQTAATISTIAFAAGRVALAAGAYLFFTAPTTDSAASSVRVAPAVGRSAGGISVGGTF